MMKESCCTKTKTVAAALLLTKKSTPLRQTTAATRNLSLRLSLEIKQTSSNHVWKRYVGDVQRIVKRRV
jgi:hypothetical protein